ncbi:hypothetical protein Rhopal_002892-T1 [Rhodotorula paludigena]|uniref:Kinesin-domain-containing protein n=1 Tax=Rhodotorula paludigena TaxID=86838 RepID=A0AAV5GMJ5_9BASI|nr:hypothetical protein Rhopal_002892-T1 [Rhodotorula paludigena]
MSAGGGNIKVVVRCRPLNSRELARGAKSLVRMEGNNTYLDPPEAANVTSGRVTEKETKSFAFDKSYWSACSKDDPSYASQQTLFDDLGRELLDHAFEGYNTALFAYGQTGSGKSYSMMGYGADRGIIPLLCEALFERMQSKEASEDGLSFTVEVSYTEIYQEKVRDLLNPSNKGNLKVREHPTLGPYVENLSKCAVQNFDDIEHLMDEGTKARTVAATQMNETSSRSHAVFTLVLTQKRLDRSTNMVGEKVSRISLIDLAGSERANSTGATGTRLKEGALINKSLSTLGRVIAALAAASAAKTEKAAKAAAEKVPYRDSVLTWLLKDSLGGNSKTAMIAAISPADYEETLSTLRYADQAKKIKNKAVVNEDPNAKLIRELKEELTLLRSRMAGPSALGNGGSPSLAGEATWDATIPPSQQLVQYQTASGELRTISKAELQDQLEASEKLMASVTETWEQKLEKTREVQVEREKALENLGITIEKNLVGVHAPKKMPHLVNLSEDPLMAECLMYQIKPGRTTVGNSESDVPADIKLSGSNILSEHCHFEYADNGTVTLHARAKGNTMVNGLRIPPDRPKELQSGFRIILGDFHVFRFNHPEQVRKARESKPTPLRSPLVDVHDEGTASPATRPESPLSLAPENADWSYARREAVVARLNGKDVKLDQMSDDELSRLYSSILRVRHSRTASSVAGSDRPESRMSYLDSVTEDDDDDEEDDERVRPFSSGTWGTDPMSLADSTLTLSHLPNLDEKPFGLDLPVAPSTPAAPPSASSANAAHEAEQQEKDRRAEEKVKQLEAQLRAQRKRIAKLRSTGSGADANGSAELDDLFDEWPRLSPEQEQLARKVVVAWRKRRRVRMAEDALSQAAVLKEVNVMSRELKKGVSYQFVVVEREVPSSAIEAISGLGDIEELADPALATGAKPCIGVKVLDRRNQVISLWSLAKLQQRLQQMRNQYRWLDKPEYNRHFSTDDPFYESPPPPAGFSLVSTSVLSLVPLARNLPAVQIVQLYSPYIADPIGSCRVRIKPIEVRSPPTSSSTSLVHENGTRSHSGLVEGGTLVVDVAIDSVLGFDKSEFASLHLQVSTASLFGADPERDEVVTSGVVDLDANSLTTLSFARRFEVQLTPSVLRHLRDSHGQVAAFGRPRLAHFDKIEHWDEARDGPSTSRVANAPGVRGDPNHGDVTRRPETEFVGEQQHDILARIEIRELGERGEYEPVQVVAVNNLDAGAFFLRQGIQRRFVLELSHNSGRALAWKRISKVALGNVRMLDSRGRVHAATSTADADLRGMGTQRPQYTVDGLATLAFAGAWDSSVHDSPHLNRSTPSGSRALIRLTFEVEIAGCSAPVPFSMDIAVTISSRDARPPNKLVSLFNSYRLSSRISSVFSVTLRPHRVRKPGDVWRLDTSETYVRGEELLSGWRPRGLSLVRDYDSASAVKRKAADVEATKAILEAFELTLPTIEDVPPEDRLRLALAYWQKQFGTKDEVSLERQQTAPALLDLASPSLSPSPSARDSPSDTANKRGALSLLRDPTSNQWRKHWFVLRRPYLYIYSSTAEADEAAVINVSTVRVEQSPEIEQMLERKFAFAIFTPHNSYFFAAPNLREMLDWIKAIDPSLA